MKSALSAGTNKSGTKELRNQRNTERKKLPVRPSDRQFFAFFVSAIRWSSAISLGENLG